MTRRHPDDDFAGLCPYHGDCLEGMASGLAVEARWQMKGHELPANHQAWAIEAFYIAHALTGIILMVSPKKIILGGGIMKQMQLFPMIRDEVRRNLNGYVSTETIISDIERYINPPGLGDNAGISGALALGMMALNNKVNI